MIDEKLLEKALRNVVKTGRYALGVKEALRVIRGSRLIVYSKSLSEDTRARILELCQTSSVHALPYEGSSMKLGKLCGRPFRVSVIAVRSPGEADISPLMEASQSSSATKKILDEQ